MTLNSLPLLRTVTADRAAPALDAPGNPEAADSGAAFGVSLAGLLQGGGGEALPALPLARGGDALPDGGKDLPPAPAGMLPAGELPGIPRGSSAAADRVAGSPVDAVPQEPAALSTEAAPVSAAGNPAPVLPFPESPAHAAPLQTAGTSPAGVRQPAVLPPERAALASSRAEVQNRPSSSSGNRHDDALAALSRRVPHQAAGTTGDIRQYAARPVIRPAPGAHQDTRRSGPDARYAAPAPVARPQTDVPIGPPIAEAVEGHDGKALAVAAGGAASSASGPSPAPLSAAAAAAQPPAGGQAPVPPAATATPAALPAINVPPGADGWGDALGDRVIMMAGQRLQTADIRLNPADLGPLRVQVSVDDGTVSVSFHAQHALTRDAIEQALPRLRDLLGDNGLALADASVSDQGAPRQEADDSRDPAAYGSAPVNDGSFAGAAESGPTAARRIAASSLVDLFA